MGRVFGGMKPRFWGEIDLAHLQYHKSAVSGVRGCDGSWNRGVSQPPPSGSKFDSAVGHISPSRHGLKKALTKLADRESSVTWTFKARTRLAYRRQSSTSLILCGVIAACPSSLR